LRKSPKDTRELVEAAKQDFIAGAESEATLRIRLGMLVPKSEVTYEVSLAMLDLQKKGRADDRYQRSTRWLDIYLKR